MLSKSDIRKRILIERKKLTSRIYSEKIIEYIKSDENFIKSKYIGLYMPLLGEVDLLSLIEENKDKVFSFPTITNSKIEYYEYTKDSEFVKSNFNVEEIKNGVKRTSDITYCLVPALALNEKGYRIGYGKGYFDKFFSIHPNIIKVGITNAKIEVFKEEAHDIKMDYYFIG